MSKKDYELIAGVFARAAEAYGGAGWGPERRTIGIVAEIMADKLRADNPRFDRARFLKASGVES
jgi:hypothetical protein